MGESGDHITHVGSGASARHLGRRALDHFRRPHVARIWLLAVCSRLVVFAIGLAAITAGTHTPSPVDVAEPVSPSEIGNLPYRWDAEWYVSIARDGYSWHADRRAEQQSIAFFPGYPLLMRAGGGVLGLVATTLQRPSLFGTDAARLLWGGVLVSIICFALALENVYALALLDSGSATVANRAVLLLACYPFALFLGVAYSESAALLGMTSMTLAWRRARFGRAAVWGVFAGLVRSNGWTLSGAFLLEWFVTRRHARALPRAAAAMGPVVGLALVCAFMYALTDNPLEWVAAQKAWVGEPGVLTFLTRRAASVMELGVVGHVRRDTVDAMAVACVAFMLALAVRFAVRRELLYAALIVGYLAPALAIDLPSLGRLTTVLFPAFIAVASMAGRVSGVVVAVIFATGQVWLAWLFFQWLPPF